MSNFAQHNRQGISRFVGLPYRLHGRDLNGVDCWGLVQLVLAGECGVTVSVYGDMRDASEIAAQSNGPLWQKLEKPEAWCVARMLTPCVIDNRAKRMPLHCGVMINATQLLHVDIDGLSEIVDIKDYRVSHRIDGYYKWIG